MKKLHRTAAFVACLTVLFSACKKDWNELGANLIVEEDFNLVHIDSFSIETSVMIDDSIKALNHNNVFLGSINDPVFGSSKASFYTEFRLPSSDVDFGDEAQADSIVLSLAYSSFYGDTTIAQFISVHELTEAISPTVTDSSGTDSTLVFYTFDDFDYDASPLFSQSVSTYPSQKVWVDGEEEVAQLRLHLPIEWAQHILDAGSENLADNEAFLEFFKGFYIQADASGLGALLKFDLLHQASSMEVYYHNAEGDSLSYDLQINQNSNRSVHWDNDYSGTELSSIIEGVITDHDAYLQAGSGLKTILEIPYIRYLIPTNSTLEDSAVYVIHKAELILPNRSSLNDSLFTIPSSLQLEALDENGERIALAEDLAQGPAYFDGKYDEESGDYRFNIARYVQKVLLEGYTNQLVLSVPSSATSADRVALQAMQADSLGVRLNLTLSKQ